MTLDEITDRNSLRAWLDGQSRNVSVSIAHRAAMRVAPLLWLNLSPASSEIALNAHVSARAMLIASAVGTSPSATMADSVEAAIAVAAAVPAAAAAAYALRAAAADPEASGSYSASSFAAAAAGHAHGDGAIAYASVFPSNRAAKAWLDIAQDAKALAGADTGRHVAATPLWPQGTNPLADDWQKVRKAWASNTGDGWQFWIDWYEAALAGRPLLGDWDRHWDLLTDIALIDPDKWDAGPDTVNPLVAQKYEIHGLRAEADRLKRELQRAEATAATAAHRSHNQPPDLVETPSVQQYRVVLKALDDAETELAKPDPSSSRLRAIANVLLDWTKGVAAYCAELGDVALKEVAKGIGRAAVPGTALFLAAQSEQVRQIANGLVDLASRLP